jgi:hypothetical protein
MDALKDVKANKVSHTVPLPDSKNPIFIDSQQEYEDKLNAEFTQYLINNRKDYVHEGNLTERVKQGAMKVGLENIQKSAL